MSNLGRSLSRAFMKWKLPYFDQYNSTYKVPINPKIVVYGAYNQLFHQILQRQFKDYEQVQTTELIGQGNQTGFDEVETVAQALVRIRENFGNSYFIKDFPRTPEQAARLDSLLDGVNLAINIQISDNVASQLSGKYLECKNCGTLFNTALEATIPHLPGKGEGCPTPEKCNITESSANLSSKSAEYLSTYNPVFQYYAKRGLLLNFDVNERLTFQETVDRLNDEIVANIKL